MKDIVIGAIANHDWHDIQHWCNSLDKSGFVGDKVLIDYTPTKQLLSELQSRAYVIIRADNHEDMNKFKGRANEVITLRFRHFWTYLNTLDLTQYRYVISTDVRDLVFQSNPSKWVEQNIGEKSLLVVDEALTFGEMQWAPNKMKTFFGEFFRNYMSAAQSYNAGVIAGKAQLFRDFMAQIYLGAFSAQFRELPHHGIDQMAFNLLLTFEPWKGITQFTSCKDQWVAHLGVQADPKNSHLIKSVNCIPRERDGIIYPPDSDIPYAIVHQFDRVPDWNITLRQKYQ